MATGQTEAVIFKEYIDAGMPTPDHFPVKQVPRSEPKDGEVEVEVIYLSVDPYMRGRMRQTPGYFIGPFQPGSPPEGDGIGVVTKSRAAELPVGTYVEGSLTLKWQRFQVQPASGLRKIPLELIRSLGSPPLSIFLGPLGMTGQTAYSALTEIAKPKQGETVFVTGASGAVGVIVGQLCKHVYGCKVVGAAGSDDKVAYIKSHCGYDEAFNYKSEKWGDALQKYCPNGIDVYYDNVGGEALEAALDNCNKNARVVMCGAISQYNDKREEAFGVRNLFNVTTKRILMQGFIVADWNHKYDEFIRDMTQYVREGKVHGVEHVVQGGLSRMGEAFVGLMTGKNLGKMVVQVGPDPLRSHAAAPAGVQEA